MHVVYSYCRHLGYRKGQIFQQDSKGNSKFFRSWKGIPVEQQHVLVIGLPDIQHDEGNAMKISLTKENVHCHVERYLLSQRKMNQRNSTNKWRGREGPIVRE